MSTSEARRPAALLFLDVETTGVDPARDEILEIAWLGLAEDPETTCSLLPAVPPSTRMTVEAATMHAASGLLVERDAAREHLVPLTLVDEMLWGRLQRMQAESGAKPQLAGFSVHFDLAFLRAKMPRAAALLSHRVMNVSSLRDFFSDCGPQYAFAAEGAVSSKHRALADCECAQAVYLASRDWVRAQVARQSVVGDASTGTGGV